MVLRHSACVNQTARPDGSHKGRVCQHVQQTRLPECGKPRQKQWPLSGKLASIRKRTPAGPGTKRCQERTRCRDRHKRGAQGNRALQQTACPVHQPTRLSPAVGPKACSVGACDARRSPARRLPCPGCATHACPDARGLYRHLAEYCRCRHSLTCVVKWWRQAWH